MVVIKMYILSSYFTMMHDFAKMLLEKQYIVLYKTN